MANRIGNSVSLMRASFNVLKLDKELMLFPIMSGIASVLVMASFVVPVVMTGGGEFLESGSGGYQTGKRSSSGKNVLGAIAKLKNMKG